MQTIIVNLHTGGVSEFGWDSLVAIATAALASVTAWLAWSTRKTPADSRPELEHDNPCGSRNHAGVARRPARRSANGSCLYERAHEPMPHPGGREPASNRTNHRTRPALLQREQRREQLLPRAQRTAWPCTGVDGAAGCPVAAPAQPLHNIAVARATAIVRQVLRSGRTQRSMYVHCDRAEIAANGSPPSDVPGQPGAHVVAAARRAPRGRPGSRPHGRRRAA